MRITIYCVGKKHDAIFVQAINDYVARVERTVSLRWELIPPSGLAEKQARTEETAMLLKRIPLDDIVWLLDETGELISSVAVAKKIAIVQQTGKNLSLIIGGAYGVTTEMHDRANFVWSLSPLVFPHQLVRLILAEQLYRAYEIQRGSGYHHK